MNNQADVVAAASLIVSMAHGQKRAYENGPVVQPKRFCFDEEAREIPLRVAALQKKNTQLTAQVYQLQTEADVPVSRTKLYQQLWQKNDRLRKKVESVELLLKQLRAAHASLTSANLALVGQLDRLRAETASLADAHGACLVENAELKAQLAVLQADAIKKQTAHTRLLSMYNMSRVANESLVAQINRLTEFYISDKFNAATELSLVQKDLVLQIDTENSSR